MEELDTELDYDFEGENKDPSAVTTNSEQTDKTDKKEDTQTSTFEEGEVKGEGDEGAKGSAQDSQKTKLSKKEPENPRKNIDYSLIDSLCSFVESDDQLLPILCGYFHKIMQQLLMKQKNLFLEYLLLERRGKIFNGLLKHIEHHSIALLLIALLDVNIVPESSKKAKQRVWDIRDESESEGNEETNEAELTADQKQMKEILSEKGKMVVEHLLTHLSSKNKDDIHKTLNASTVLQEFVDNENCFPILTQKSSLSKLVQICFTTEDNKQNLPYALSLLSTIINQFIEHEKAFFQDKKEEFFEIFAQYFTHLVYNCLIILRQNNLGPDDSYTNQSG